MIFLFVLFLHPNYAQAGWWQGFCARYLISDHPYQVWVRTLPTAQVIREFRRVGALRQWGRDEKDEYEMVEYVMVDRFPDATPDEQQQIQDALEDYPHR